MESYKTENLRKECVYLSFPLYFICIMVTSFGERYFDYFDGIEMMKQLLLSFTGMAGLVFVIFGFKKIIENKSACVLLVTAVVVTIISRIVIFPIISSTGFSDANWIVASDIISRANGISTIRALVIVALFTFVYSDEEGRLPLVKMFLNVLICVASIVLLICPYIEDINSFFGEIILVPTFIFFLLALHNYGGLPKEHKGIRVQLYSVMFTYQIALCINGFITGIFGIYNLYFCIPLSIIFLVAGFKVISRDKANSNKEHDEEKLMKSTSEIETKQSTSRFEEERFN